MPKESIVLVTGATKAVGCAEHASIGQAEKIPVSAPTPVVSISPVVVSVPGRIVKLQIRISAPTTGRDLPIIPAAFLDDPGLLGREMEEHLDLEGRHLARQVPKTQKCRVPAVHCAPP